MNKAAPKNRFQKANKITIILLFVVILAGAVVRSTGSGMGCPDWPRCFGCIIPPTDVSQLPAGYKEKYVADRVKKNLHFAKTLDLFGYNDLAIRLRQDKSILVPESFNAAKTWTEYINRLLGVAAGLGMILTAVFAFRYWGQNKWLSILSLLNLVVVGFQGWLGSIVVSTNLVPWIVTVHMLLALAVLAIAIVTYHLAKVQGKNWLNITPIVRVITYIALAISVVQIVFGTDVRERVDVVAARLSDYRNGWINSVGDIFFEHRDLAIILLLTNVMLYALVRRHFNRHSVQQQLMSFTFLVIMLQIVTGILLSYLSLPPLAEVAHVVLACLMFGAQLYLLLNLYKSATITEVRR